MIKSNANYFDSIADKYGTGLRGVMWGPLRKSESLAVMEFFPSDMEAMDILELGCGVGFYTDQIKSLGYKTFACVDISKKMLDKVYAKESEKIQADIETFVSEKKYDLIICAGAIEFLSDINNFFSNTSRMLKKNGEVIVLYPRKNFLGRLYRIYHISHGLDCRLFEEGEIKSLCYKYSFVIMSEKRCGLFATVVKLKKYG